MLRRTVGNSIRGPCEGGNRDTAERGIPHLRGTAFGVGR